MPQSQDLQSLASNSLAFGLLFMLAVLAIGFALIALWIWALVHCIKYQHSKDRTVWILVTLLGGPIGSVIYFAIGRPAKAATPPVIAATPRSTVTAPAAPIASFDHDAIADPHKRAQAISEALWSQSKASKRR